MKLTVSIPAYNAGTYLAETMASILDQELWDYELVVCDDRSTDGTAEVARSFHDSRIRYELNPENLGPPGNFNRCLDEATGEYVCIFHADDVMQPDNLAQKIEWLDQYPHVGLVHSNAVYIDEHGAEGELVLAADIPASIRSGVELFDEWLRTDNEVVAPSVVMRRSVVEQVGRFETGITHTQDLNFWLRMAATADVAYIAEPLIKYRRHSGQDTNRYSQARLIREDWLARKWAFREARGAGYGVRGIRSEDRSRDNVPLTWRSEVSGRRRAQMGYLQDKYSIRALNSAERCLAEGDCEEGRKLVILAAQIKPLVRLNKQWLRLRVKAIAGAVRPH